MNSILVTTTHRHCEPGEPSGFVYMLDLKRGKVTGGCPMIEPPYRDLDPNPRGGMRGAKGIAVVEDQVLLANASVIYHFDRSWNMVRTISHPSCASIHDILWHDGGLWVTSCSNDLVFQFDPDGHVLQLLNMRSFPTVGQALHWNPPDRLAAEAILAGAIDFRDPRTHRAEDFDAAHVNSLCVLPDGDLLVLLGHMWTKLWSTQLRLKGHLKALGLWKPLAGMLRPILRPLPLTRVSRGDLGASLATAGAAILRISRQGKASICWQLTKRRMPTHSLVALPDGTVLFADTTDGCIVHLDPADGRQLARIKVTNDFLRGICPLSPQEVLVGSQRDVLRVDLARQQVVQSIRLTDNANVSVFAIKELPPDFLPLPRRFVSDVSQCRLVTC
jgi:hypothetical protein